jgi:hypothetical protein
MSSIDSRGVFSLIHTSTTSRRAVLKKYKPLFTNIRRKSVCYFNSSKDIFHVADIDTLEDLMDRALGSRQKLYRWDYDQAKNLAIQIDDMDTTTHLKDIKK